VDRSFPPSSRRGCPETFCRDYLIRILDYIGRHAALFLAGGVFLGLAIPSLATAARPLLAPALILPLTIALLRLDWQHLYDYARRPALVAVATIWLLGVSPLLLWFVLKGVPLPPALAQALVLAAASSPVTMCATVSLIVGLDAALAVVVVVVTTALVPLTLPMLSLSLLGMNLDIGLGTFMARLSWLIGIPFAVALVARKLAGLERLARNARPLDAIAVISLVIFAIAIMDGITAAGFERPGAVIGTLVAAFAANVTLQIAGTLAFWRLGARRALTIGLMTGNLNMGIILVALADKADFDIVMFFALGQLPMYILPALLGPLYRHLVRTDLTATHREGG
jgi:BASS family bile acid:Na+ symporter